MIRYRKFPIFSTIGAIADAASASIPAIFFVTVFGPAASGLYVIALRVSQFPASVIGGALGQVFFASAADAHRSGVLGPLVAQVHKKLAHIGFPAVFLFFLLAPDLFAFIFGDGWRQSGEIARWIAPWTYLQFISSPLSVALSVTYKVKKTTWWQLALLFSTLGALLVGSWFNNILIAIIVLSSANMICYLVLLGLIAQSSGNSPSSMLLDTLYAGFVSLLCASPLLTVLAMLDESLAALVGASAVSLIFVAVRLVTVSRSEW